MDPVAVLRREHVAIEMELSELEFIMDGLKEGAPFSQVAVAYDGRQGNINYSNLVHTFWKACELWERHEQMEEEIFGVMKKEGFEIKIETILLEHEKLEGYVKRISDAINSGSDFEVRKALAKDMREFVGVLRKHTEDEEEILFGVVVSNFSKEGMREIKGIVGKYGA